jgi:DNA-binding transcriptional ArsR family regulator
MVDMDIKRLAAQLDAAQAILDDIRTTSGCEAFAPLRKSSLSRVESALETAERAYKERLKRTDFVGHKELFGEPAWDMLLDLFIRQSKSEEISVKSACLNADMPAPTVARWIKVLESNGLIISQQDPGDEMRSLINLTQAGYEAMLRYFESIA